MAKKKSKKKVVKRPKVKKNRSLFDIKKRKLNLSGD